MINARIIETEDHKTGTHKVDLYVNAHFENRFSSYHEALAAAMELKDVEEPMVLLYRYIYLSAKKEWKYEDWKEIV